MIHLHSVSLCPLIPLCAAFHMTGNDDRNQQRYQIAPDFSPIPWYTADTLVYCIARCKDLRPRRVRLTNRLLSEWILSWDYQIDCSKLRAMNWTLDPVSARFESYHILICATSKRSKIMYAFWKMAYYLPDLCRTLLNLWDGGMSINSPRSKNPWKWGS